MTRKIFRCLSVTALSLTLLANSLPAWACAGSNDPYFSYTNHPDFPMKKYAAGELGILGPGYARSYLLAAYRYLEGKPLSPAEQASFVSLWMSRLTDQDTSMQDADSSKWLAERKQVPGASKIDSIPTTRPVSDDEPWQTYANCQTAAFDTAAATLRKLIAEHGADSKEVKEWLSAQDEVFSNCGQIPYAQKPPVTVIPKPLPADASKEMQQQRAYQIAAANFYARNFDAARQQFDAIAADASSPWASIAGYLAARTMIRQATLAKQMNKPLLQQAQQRIATLEREPSMSALARDLQDLASFIEARLAPEQHLQHLLAAGLTGDNAGEITKTIDLLLPDDETGEPLDYAKAPAVLKKNDITDWVLTFQSTPTAKAHAFEQWERTKSLPWLVAAMEAVEPTSPQAAVLMNAAAPHEHAGDPAHWSLFYHTIRLQLAQNKLNEARKALDAVLDHLPADLPPSAVNDLKTQRLAVAENTDELVKYGVQKPLAIIYSGGVEGVPDDPKAHEDGTAKDQTKPEFTPELAQILNQQLPLSVLQEVAANKQLPTDLKNALVWASWVRAVLVGNNNAARALAPAVKQLNPKKSKYIDIYLAATTPDEQKFAATFLMLHFSSADPVVSSGELDEDAYGDASGWWWFANPIGVASDPKSDNAPPVQQPVPLFLTPAQKAQAKAEVAKVAAVPPAPEYFGKIVLDWANSHPTDERVPEALAWLVKATHYGASGDATSRISKQAFQVLHTKYKTSPWTKKTPYYY